MRRITLSVFLSGMMVLAASCRASRADSERANPWSLTLYGGPATDTIFTDFVGGRYRWSGGLIALAADRQLAYLGWGWCLVGELQVQQFTFGHNYNSAALGLGVEFNDFPWQRSLRTDFSVFTGPTYSVNPPQYYPTSQWGSKKNLLNYVGAELAFAPPEEQHWDVVLRFYHRSGVWGIYTLDPDEVTSLGLGLRYRF